MEPTYNQQQQEARARLRRAMHPASADEHRHVDWLLGMLTPTEVDLWAEMVERRVWTSVRAARMELADQVLQGWQPSAEAGSVDVINRMMHIASGGDDDVARSDEVAGADQRGRQIASAYDKGWQEGIAHVREQAERGIAPGGWDVS